MKIIANLALALFLFSSVAYAGWGKTEWGMRKSEVEKAIGKELVVDESSESNYYTSYLVGYKIYTLDFEVSFQMLDNKLDNVEMQYKGDKRLSHNIFKYLKEDLEKKYGFFGNEEETIEKDVASTIETKSYKWITDDTWIKLSYRIMVLGDDTHKDVYVHYSTRVSHIADDI